MGPANQLLPRQHTTRKIRMVTRTRVTNQRKRTSVEDVEDTVADTVADTEVDTVYPKEDKVAVAEESVTRSHLIKIIILRILGLGLILRITLRIVLAMINVPFTERRVTTRRIIGNTKSISLYA